jgi:hypothetical protein
MRSAIVTSCVSESISRGHQRRDQEGLTVEQRAKVVQRGYRNTRTNFVGELLTGKRIQHPGRDGHLHVISELDDHAISRIAPKPTNDLYVFAVERMVTVVNDRWRRFMSSVRMRCATRTQPISWKRAPTCARSSCCSVT